MITYTILGVPYYIFFSIMGPQSLFYVLRAPRVASQPQHESNDPQARTCEASSAARDLP